jgi:8-oxo-dGTP pyrophosphatase MutT (NUDIX family)
MRPTKWTIESSRTIHADRWIDVRADRVVMGNGHVLDPFYVLHYADWVHVIAVTTDDHMVLVRQYRHGGGIINLETPGGIVDAADTDPLQAAVRELREETGFCSPNNKLIGSLYANPATHTNRIHTFLAMDAVASGNIDPDEGEELEVVLMPVAEVAQGLSRGLVAQSTHVASIYLALAALGRLPA